jgi:hypothetical protein
LTIQYASRTGVSGKMLNLFGLKPDALMGVHGKVRYPVAFGAVNHHSPSTHWAHNYA